ncbi:MAG TPA: amidohydrolase family protein [Terriglobales bacterium]|nr:amidohydrolase family protein [Terriglobales bacterium]
MRPMLCCLLLALVAFTSTIAAQNSPSVTTRPPTATVYLTHVTLIDTVAGRELPDRTVVISGDRISEVKAAKGTKLPSDVQIIEGKGKYLIPGLWDMHVHALFPERVGSMFPMFVANGVVGIRDMGTSMPLADIERLRQEIASGSRLGPRFVAAGPLLDGRPKPLRPNFLAITTPEQGRATVDSLKSDGADFIKVYSWLSRDTFLSIAGEANKLKIPFAGHVPFSVPALEASDAGMKSMEHLHGVVLSCSAREDELRSEMLKGGANLPGDDRLRLEMHEAAASYDDRKAAPIFAHLAKNKTWQVPTLVVRVPYVQSFDTRVTTDPRLKYIPPSAQQRWTEEAKSSTDGATSARTFEKQSQIVGAMQRAGVPIMAGTDAAWYQPYTYAGFSLHDELGLLVRAGLTPAQALQSATIDPARFIGRDQDLGSIERGKFADMVLLDADPLSDISNTQKINTVIVNGRELDRKALDSLLADAENAVKNR